MPEFDLTDRITEQVLPVMRTLKGRLEGDLSNDELAAIVHALVDAATVGARVGYTAALANAVEAGLALPEELNVEGLRNQNLWPFED
jgi:hypothetical protein